MTKDSKQVLVSCTYERHAVAMLEILNEAIANSTALYDYEPRTMAQMTSWFEIKKNENFPVIGIENAEGKLLGFGSYGTFRAWAAYKYTVEHSIYIHKNYRHQGLGKTIMEALIAEASKQNLHVMVGGIDATNKSSILLHEKLGFKHVGTLNEVGFKFDRWLDLAFYQLTLNSSK